MAIPFEGSALDFAGVWFFVEGVLEVLGFVEEGFEVFCGFWWYVASESNFELHGQIFGAGCFSWDGFHYAGDAIISREKFLEHLGFIKYNIDFFFILVISRHVV